MEFIKVNSQVQPFTALIELNRPKALNALNPQLMEELLQALQDLDRDESVRVIVLTGNDQAFAAGADIKQMADKNSEQMKSMDQFSTWDKIAEVSKPIIAAVSGYALGGGCELAMMCDIIIASETAQFGQPEIKIGTIPGAGGTQRLTRAIGKSKAMELILTGKFVSANDALLSGLVSRVVPASEYLNESLKIAEAIAQQSPVIIRLAKKAVNQAFNATLSEGLQFEREKFYQTFDTEDQKEGMQAFTEKRKPVFKGK
jgi:enoyl-CoA hydratase